VERLPYHQRCIRGRLRTHITHNKLSCLRRHILILPRSCLLIRLPQPKLDLVHQFGERHPKRLGLGEHGIGPILGRVRDVIPSVVGHEGIPGRIQV